MALSLQATPILPASEEREISPFVLSTAQLLKRLKICDCCAIAAHPDRQAIDASIFQTRDCMTYPRSARIQAQPEVEGNTAHAKATPEAWHHQFVRG